ncbi:MAG: trehalase family glycosidase, partial [Kiritimatiellia bacterium]
EYSADVARVDLESIAENTAGMKFIVPGAPDECVTVKVRDVPLKARAGKGSFLSDLRSRFGLPPLAAERDASVLPWVGLDSDHITVPARSNRMVSLEITFGSSVAGNRPKIAAPGMPEPPRGPYADLAARLRDALLFNINYPFNISGGPSHYFVPSKYFPLPYSWDGGFIAVGMATFVPGLARRQAAYFLADENTESPFIYCGSPVPTQLYALWDTYQATQDKEFLDRIYSGARRMYDFYLGRTPGSIVNEHGDGMLSTYPYNYNLGIDDHPIQRWAEEQHLTRKGLYSIILMPQILRAARIMRNAAWLLGLEADAGQYGQDVSLLADIIDRRMWDEESGFYGWLCRTAQGVEPVRMDGCAGDRSACAFLPLFAGQTARKERLIGQMTDPARFKTPHGISSVDMSAPSYNPRGYWNGAIWPVMQWYLWRGLLEAGEPALARTVAESILGTWQKSLETEHYLGEHFVIDKALMNGAPNFGGLSATLLPMHAAYFVPYHVTALYDVAILRLAADPARDTLELGLGARFLEAPHHDLLVNMGRPRVSYAVDLNGKRHGIYVSEECGHLALRLPRPAGIDKVVIRRSGNGNA